MPKEKQNEIIPRKEQIESSYEYQLLLSRVEAQDRLFRYFSDGVYDNVGQLLSLVKMQLHNIRNHSTDPEIAGKAINSAGLLATAINDLRALSDMLHKPFPTVLSLAEAVSENVANICRTSGVVCGLHISGDEFDLGGEREQLICAIIEQGLANAIQQSKATTTEVYLDFYADSLAVRITDNGSGFEEEHEEGRGKDLANMQLRCSLLSSKLIVDATPGSGTTISMVISRQATQAE